MLQGNDRSFPQGEWAVLCTGRLGAFPGKLAIFGSRRIGSLLYRESGRAYVQGEQAVNSYCTEERAVLYTGIVGGVFFRKSGWSAIAKAWAEICTGAFCKG